MEFNIKNIGKDTSKTFEINADEALETAVKTAARVVDTAKFYAMYKFISTGFDIVALMNDNKLAKAAIKFGGRCIATSMALKTTPSFRKSLKNAETKIEDAVKSEPPAEEEQGDS